ncbi:flagellar basal body L-ring protein FlgH [Candidatus Margulisiibacteriota bacterium]
MRSLIRNTLKLILINCFLFIFISCSWADSLWQSARTPIYGTPSKEIRVGDIITIRISESSSAVHEASTRTSKLSQIGTDFLSNWDQVANILGSETIRKQHEFGLEGNDAYRGLGQTSRKSRLTAIISGRVTEILENGNIFLVAERKLKINNEVEILRISGTINPEDIDSNNSVASYQIAEAEVSVLGSGVIGNKQSPGILTKSLNWLF